MENQESSKVYVGFDPGIKGFICIYDPIDNSQKFYSMPKSGGELDLKSLYLICREIKRDYSDKTIVVGFEDVHAIYGSSAAATFSFGKVVGQQQMAIISVLSFEDQVELISPKKWQSLMWRGVEKLKLPSRSGKTMKTDTKGTSLLAAQKLWPNQDWRKSTRAKNPDDNKVDAALIAKYLSIKY